MTSENQRGSSYRSNMIADFFIDRPIFAIVLAISISLAGLLGIYTLAIAQYPDVAPVTVRVSANYSGATADAVENTVTAKLESVMTGLDGLLYMESTSSTGKSQISLTFSNDVDPDFAQVQVQNKVSRVESQLPSAVQTDGVVVTRSGSGFLLVGTLVSEDGRYTSSQLSDMVSSQVEDKIQRVDGVGSIQSFASKYAMRIWLNPDQLAKYQLTPADVSTAISAQNAQISAGSLGAIPSVKGQQMNVSIVAQTQMSKPDEFKKIKLKTETDGSIVRLEDVARVEIGLETYGSQSFYNGHAASGFAVQLATGANAISTAEGVHSEMDQIAKSLPTGVKVVYAYETTPFVMLSIEKVVHTLIEAIILVFFVLLIFLQNIRATFIPMIAVPVVLLGTFGILAAFGYSINMLTMFAMVLAIGLLVDDAIVVVENVERTMSEDGLSPREATRKSMGEITGALIGVALVLTAVFIPMAFFSGSVGVIYRQFSVTIASAMLLSAFAAIVLTPALTAMLLKPHNGGGLVRYMGWFNRGFDKATRGYTSTVNFTVLRPIRAILIFAILVGGAGYLYQKMASAFLPQEDQGVLMVIIKTPPGSTAERTRVVEDQVRDYFLTQEKDSVQGVFIAEGFSFEGSGQNMAMGFIRLKDFDQRTDPSQNSQMISMRAMVKLSQIRDAQVFALAPPAIQGLGQSGGFSMYMEDSGNLGRAALEVAGNKLADTVQKDPKVTNLRGNTRVLDTQLKINVDQEKAGALGVSIADANALINTAFAGSYVNDFIYNGDVKTVYVQGDAPYRMQPTDLYRWFARNSDDEMVPLSAFTTSQWQKGNPTLYRFNGTPAISLSGQAGQGVSSGDAMDEMEKLVTSMEGGYQVAWSGLSYQEKLAGSQAAMLYGISLLVVFLCLAALYESWSIPLSVILAVPVGVFGAVAAANLFGQSNDVYFKVGLLTTIGLTAKNAILIVEFAKDMREQGMSLLDATIEACRLRLRPIMMTSLAFILGVLPLAIATGASSAAQNAIGIGVMGGMIAATVLGIFFVPMLFVVVMRLAGKGKTPAKPQGDQPVTENA